MDPESLYAKTCIDECSRCIAALIVILGALLSGCATTQFEDYPRKSASECVYSRSEEGLALGAEPITSTEVSRQYFDADLPGNDILAIYVVVTNQTPTATFLVTPESFSLSGGSRDDGAMSSRRREETATKLGWVAAGLGSPLGALIAGGVAMDAKNCQANLRMKSLQSRTISPGQSTSGFVYFQVPKRTSEGLLPDSLMVEARAIGSADVETVEVWFSQAEGFEI